MKAVGKYIVIDPIKEVDTTTKGGLILAEKQREGAQDAKPLRASKSGGALNAAPSESA